MNQIETIKIEDLLTEAGFDTEEARQRAREVLIEQKLTTSRKERMALYKKPKAFEVLKFNLARICSSVCQGLLEIECEAVFVGTSNCEVCAGSNTTRAAKIFNCELESRGIRKVVIVGGTPQQIVEIKKLCNKEEVEFRFVKGLTPSHTIKEADKNRYWADLILVWVPSEIKHRTTTKYTGERAVTQTILIQRRGVEALFQETVQYLRERENVTADRFSGAEGEKNRRFEQWQQSQGKEIVVQGKLNCRMCGASFDQPNGTRCPGCGRHNTFN